MKRIVVVIVALGLFAPRVLGVDPAVARADRAGAPAPVSRADRAGAPAPVSRASADEAMQRLLDGNDRYRYDESTFPRHGAKRRADTFEHGQKPFAAVLACADSRAPVEAIFDQGIGDLFVVRVAGNVAHGHEIASVEYAVAHLGVPLVVVLGHTKCGAVTAAAMGEPAHGHIAGLIDHISPAVSAVKQRDPGATGNRLIRLSIRSNVMKSVHDLLSDSPVIASAVKEGRVRVVGGVYDLQTGSIEWLGAHPQQAELIDHPAPASGEKPTKRRPGEVPSVSSPTGEPSAESGHTDEPGKNDSPSASSVPTRRENWAALGGLLGFSTLASGATIHFVYGRR